MVLTLSSYKFISRDYFSLCFDIQEHYLIPQLPTKNIYPPVSDVVPSCNCKQCSRKSCVCVKHVLPYKVNDTCENKFENNK